MIRTERREASRSQSLHLGTDLYIRAYVGS